MPEGPAASVAKAVTEVSVARAGQAVQAGQQITIPTIRARGDPGEQEGIAEETVNQEQRPGQQDTRAIAASTLPLREGRQVRAVVREVSWLARSPAATVQPLAQEAGLGEGLVSLLPQRPEMARRETQAQTGPLVVPVAVG